MNTPKQRKKAEPKFIQVRRIMNPFDPLRDVRNEQWSWKKGRTLAAYLPLGTTDDYVISRNGGVITSDNFDQVLVQPDDFIVLCPVPRGGGGGGKMMLRIVGMIAIAVASFYTGGAAAAAYGGVAGAAAGAAVSIAGSLLLNALLPPPVPTNSASTLESSSTYGADGAKNTSDENIPVPAVYGQFRTAGNIIGVHTESNGNDQVLFMLINAGEGPIASISDIRLNNRSIDEFTQASVQTRMGDASQAIIDWFSQVITPYSKSQQIPTDGSYLTFATQTDVEQVRVDITFPTGLFSADQKNGQLVNNSVAIQADYRRVGDPNWNSFSPNGGALICTDKLRATVRRSYTSPQVTAGKYEIRVRRNDNFVDTSVNNGKGNPVYTTNKDTTSSSDCYVSDLNEIVFDGVAYNHTALLALRIKLDQQLNGVPTVTFMHGGRLITTMTRTNGAINYATAASSNPAWILWDMLTNTRFGGGIPASRLDLDSFLEWAAYCDANGLTFNGVLDTVMNVWDAANYVSACGHAQMLTVGTRYYIAIERASDPVMMFGMGNIVQDSFKQSWMSRTDRATEIDVTFFDKTDDYKQKTVKVSSAALALDGSKQNVSAITAYGVVDIQRAYQEGAFRLNLNRYLTETCEWQSPIEAIACTAGDVVLLQHDMPSWGFSGRTAAGSTPNVIQLDKPVTMVAGKQYKLLLLNNYVVRTSGVITQIMGSFLKLSNGSPMNVRVRRVRKGGIDVGVTSTVPDGVYVDSTAGLAVGDMVQLIDTDVIDDCDVSFKEGDQESVRLISPLSYTPEPFVNYMFGETTKVKKPFRINQITLGSTDMHRTIRALEYRPEVYDLSQYGDVIKTLEPPMLDPRQAAIGVVQRLSVYEETFVSGSQILSNVRATWMQPMVGSYAGADVYVQVNGGANNRVGTVRADTNFIVPGVKRGDQVAVRVVAYDIWGKYASYEQSPAILYTVVGNVTSISVPPVTGADFLWAGRDCKLFWNYNSNTASFEFGSEPDGATGARDPQFMDYEIRVYDTNAKRKLLRTEHTTDNGYIYTYEKNLADGLHRRLTFEIAVRDIFGHIGKPAVIEAYNPPPFVTTAGQTAAFDRATIQYTHSDDPDFQGAMFYLSDISPVKLVPENIAYDGPDSAVLLTNLMFNHDYYCVIAPYDAFGRDELIPSAEIHFKTPFLDVAAIADGVLKDSQLVPGLQQRIDLVDAPAKVIGSVNERLEKAKTEITQEIDSHSDEIEAVSKKVEVVSAKTDGNAALISVEQEARATAEEAIGKRIDTVASTVAGNTAAIQTEATTRSDSDSALSTRVDVVAAATSQNSADITTEQTARADADGALSSWITTLQSTVGGNTAAIQQTASTVNGISAQYTVKIDNNGYVAGFGLASYPVNGGIVSEFAVRADTFSVQLPGYAGIRPFTIGAVYGVPRVIISNALIGDASIDNAKIGDLQVNTAKISDGAITYAKIGYAQIGTAHIGEAQIDTLRIGPNAVSTLASWSGTNMTPIYTAGGGQCLIVFDAGSGSSAFNQIRLLIDGGVTRLVYVGNNGASNTVSFATSVWQGYLPPGNHSLRCEVANGTNWTGNIPSTIAVFEAKR